jgi:hypothetical protein
MIFFRNSATIIEKKILRNHKNYQSLPYQELMEHHFVCIVRALTNTHRVSV